MTATAEKAPDWLNVSRETLVLLEQFVALVEKWNPAINLVSKRSLTDLWERHVFDSAQMFDLLPKSARKLVDLGSGGGFPGVVLAILAREIRPELQITLVEVDQRKATFLAEANRRLSLRCTVMVERIETLAPQRADVVTARALAPLAVLCGHVNRHLASDGVAIIAKGSQVDSEVADAERIWSFSMTRTLSKSDPKGTLLLMTDVRHV